MRSVLIAEDEVLVRMGLKVSVPWDKHGLAVTGEASNGTQALELYKKTLPDVLITDLIMPGMDGLELIRRIRELGHRCAVIVITCMDRFDLLKEAMNLDVVDYLVKATMYVADIEKALVKANHYLGAAQDDPAAVQDHRKEREQLLQDYVLGGAMSHEEFSRRGRACELVEQPYHLMGLVYNSRLEVSWQLQRIMRSMLSERLEKQHVAHVLQDESFLCILFEAQPEANALNEAICDLSAYMEDNFSLNITALACAAPISSGELPKAAAAFRQAAGQVDHSQPLCWVDAQGQPIRADLAREYRRLRALLWQTGDFSFARRTVERVYQLEAMQSGDETAFALAASGLMTSFGQLADVTGQQLPDNAMPAKLVELLCAFAQEHMPRCRAEIGRVIEAIVEHPEADMSLNDGAALAAIHPQYLSNLFKKEVGVGYSEFVNMVRITRAKQLLRDNSLSIQQVAEQCGFSDTPYFTRRFKGIVGMTPGEWRRSAK